ncbi:MAG: helix-turn-helix transcriptional regulator [Pseudomonadota bacterium]|nr:helix-turn-helix transcriptional regulator [Pseudomonadota bacterium]
MEIGTRLREERERLKIRQNDFSRFAGVTKQAQINYELNRRVPNANYLAKIAELGVDLEYVITGRRKNDLNQSDNLESVYDKVLKEDLQKLCNLIKEQMKILK